MKVLGEGGLFRKLKERRFAQFLGVYFAVSWGTLQVVDQLANRGVLPALAWRVTLTLALCCTPAVLIVTWFHGQRGDQSMPRMEKLLIGVVALFALSASGFVVRSGLSSESGAIELEEWQDPTRVAVLYFDSRGGGEDAEFIAAGLTEGLIDRLTEVDTLHVISRNGSEMVRDSDSPPDSIARTLGVGTLVDGNVAIAGDRVRVSISMIEGSSGKQVDTETIEAPRADLFALQDSLSAQVAIFLRERIGREVEVIEQRSGTESVEAWELVQRAEQIAAGARQAAAQGQQHAAIDQMAEADELLLKAEDLDPEWTLPITRRGWYAYEVGRFYGLQQEPQREPTERGLAHAARALALKPDDPDALELQGTLNYWRSLLNLVADNEEHDIVDKAEEDLRSSTLGNPRPAAALAALSHLLVTNGDIAQAKLVATQSYEEDPFLANANLTLWRLASTSWELGSVIETEKWCDVGFRRFEHDFRFRECKLMLYGLKDYPPNIDDAWEVSRQFIDLAPEVVKDLTAKRAAMYMAMALIRANLPDSAEAVAVRGRAGPEIDPLQEVSYMEAILRGWLARLYEGRGQSAEAQEQWDESVRLMGIYLAAKPAQREGFQNDARNGRTDKWFLEGLVTQPAFKALVGVR